MEAAKVSQLFRRPRLGRLFSLSLSLDYFNLSHARVLLTLGNRTETKTGVIVATNRLSVSPKSIIW